jgi:hypothetical protein
MEINKNQPQHFNSAMIWMGLFISLVVINFIFIFLTQSEFRSITLEQSELSSLNQQKSIIDASDTINRQYKNDISVISSVFPSEQSITDFIQTLEGVIKNSSDSYDQIKFNSLTPIVEGDKQFLLLTISMNTDLTGLASFLTQVEKLPYMTHITGISAKTPGGFTGKGAVLIGMKIYVQNPFSTN